MAGMFKLNALDLELITLLQNDARQNSDVLAKQLGVSSATVRRRINRLINDETIKVLVMVDPLKIGLPLAAIIALYCEKTLVSDVRLALANLPPVQWLSSTTGRFDIIFLARFKSTEDLSDFLQNSLAHVDGVKDYESFICLSFHRVHFTFDVMKPA